MKYVYAYISAQLIKKLSTTLSHGQRNWFKGTVTTLRYAVCCQHKHTIIEEPHHINSLLRCCLILPFTFLWERDRQQIKNFSGNLILTKSIDEVGTETDFCLFPKEVVWWTQASLVSLISMFIGPLSLSSSPHTTHCVWLCVSLPWETKCFSIVWNKLLLKEF